MPENKKEQVLSVRDLDITLKTTAGPVHAIRGVNIDLYKGETVALVEDGKIGTIITKDYCAIIGLNQKDLENQGILA